MNETNIEERDRVRRSTPPEMLRRIDERIEENIRTYSAQSRERLDERIRELQEEWDLERYLQTNASVLGLTSAFLGLTVSRKWLLLTGTIMGFLLQHSVQGWCPPIPLFRKMGIRTRSEIDREMYALKALRGDFADITPVTGEMSQATRAAEAVTRN